MREECAGGYLRHPGGHMILAPGLVARRVRLSCRVDRHLKGAAVVSTTVTIGLPIRSSRS